MEVIDIEKVSGPEVAIRRVIFQISVLLMSFFQTRF